MGLFSVRVEQMFLTRGKKLFRLPSQRQELQTRHFPFDGRVLSKQAYLRSRVTSVESKGRECVS